MNQHHKRILSQFTKQAVPFSKKVPAHSNKAAFNLILKTVGVHRQDLVLDVACGPGMLTTAAAQKAKHVTGIDLVPAMLKQARLLQKKLKLSNITWTRGDVASLPFKNGSFSAVFTRFSFHHFQAPKTVLKEMVRVTLPYGKIGIIDVYTRSKAHDRWHNRLEKLRDDSHVRALPLKTLQAMARQAGLVNIKTRLYRLEIELEQQISASFPKPGDEAKIRHLVAGDHKGMVSQRRAGKTYLVYPIAVIAGIKPK